MITITLTDKRTGLSISRDYDDRILSNDKNSLEVLRDMKKTIDDSNRF